VLPALTRNPDARHPPFGNGAQKLVAIEPRARRQRQG
jgi:hypothetical protein